MTEPTEPGPLAAVADFMAALDRPPGKGAAGARSRTKRKAAVPRRGPGRPADTDSAETRAKILAAARTCFARSGYDRTTNKEIAEEAHFSSGTIYHYFSSKPALFVAVANEVQRVFFSRYFETLPPDGSLVDCLVRLVDVMREVSADDPTVAAFMSIWAVEYGRHDEIRRLSASSGVEHSMELYERIARTTGAGTALGAGSRGVAAFAVCALFGLSVLVQIRPDSDLHDVAADALADLIRSSTDLGQK